MAAKGQGTNGRVRKGAAKRKASLLPESLSATRPTLIVIGGREDKIGDALILREVARHVGSGKLVVSTIASSRPDGVFEEYAEVFRRVGLTNVRKLKVANRAEAQAKKALAVFEGANAVFFTGGDQSRITSQLADTLVFRRVEEIYRSGGVIAGTSAGAAAVCSTMLAAGSNRTSPRLNDSLKMAPGLGFLDDVIIDQHFAERGRMGRLIGAVSQNPNTLGLGIDENTAVVIDRGERFYVVGAGTVYAIDGRYVTFSNVAEQDTQKTLAVYDLKLHLMTEGDSFELQSRRPTSFGAIQHIRTLEAAVAEE